MKKSLLFITLASILITGCTTSSNTIDTKNVVSYRVPYEMRKAENGTTAAFGGYGSSIAYDSRSGSYYLLTDRGPNVDGSTPESKVFPFPNFSPAIGEFRVEGDSLVLVREITIKDRDGKPLLGLPNRTGDGVTGEVAYDYLGEVITSDYWGIDSEGLALAPDGTFWVSDEYAPFVLHLDNNGYVIRSYSPSNGLPEYYAKRRPNKGMEGIAVSDDGKHIYGIMQSPLYLPDSSTKDQSLNCRIIELNVETGSTREYIYPLEDAEFIVSEITFVNDSTLLVMEHDGDFINGTDDFKMVFKIDLREATDISGRQIELLSPNELIANNIKCADKRLALDILTVIEDYPHDKPEGIALIGCGKLAIVNDDDFSVEETKKGGFKPKINASGDVDHSTIYIVDINL